MHTLDFWGLLKRHSAGDQSVEQQILAAIAADPGIVGLTYEPEQDDWEAVPASVWTWAFQKAGYTLNGMPADPPAGPTLLYRGCTQARRFGMSWTPSFTLASGFADEDGGYKGQVGNVYCHWAWGVELLARRHRVEWVRANTKIRGVIYRPQAGEYFLSDYDEWIIDRAYLDDDNVTPIAVNPANYSEMYSRYTMSGRPTGWDIKY